jgi:hypothetical protein
VVIRQENSEAGSSEFESAVVDQNSGSKQSKELDSAKKTVCDFTCAVI